MLEQLRELEKIGFLRIQSHPSLPLVVANYTDKAQYENAFGDYPILRKCRGLCLSTETDQIVSSCFVKFFNYEELQPSERPSNGDKIEITSKMDGSLIMVFRYKDQLVFRTRGSFTSDQAIAAEKLFYTIYDPNWIEDGVTILLEYISPNNRVVVQYKIDDLVHLARLDSLTGKDLSRDSRYHPVEVHEFTGGFYTDKFYNIFKAMEPELENQEGFVVRQVLDQDCQDFRQKIKTSNYVQMHRLITHLSNISLWETMMAHLDFETMLEGMPDELFDFVRHWEKKLKSEYSSIEDRAKIVLGEVQKFETRKEQAMHIMENYKDIFAVIFKMLDGHPYEELIWKLIKPKERVRPFSGAEEE